MVNFREKQDRRYSDPKARNGSKMKKNKIRRKNLLQKFVEKIPKIS